MQGLASRMRLGVVRQQCVLRPLWQRSLAHSRCVWKGEGDTSSTETVIEAASAGEAPVNENKLVKIVRAKTVQKNRDVFASQKRRKELGTMRLPMAKKDVDTTSVRVFGMPRFSIKRDVMRVVTKHVDASCVVDVMPIYDSTTMLLMEGEWKVTLATIADARQFLRSLNSAQNTVGDREGEYFGRPANLTQVRTAHATQEPFATGLAYLVLRKLPRGDLPLRRLRTRIAQNVTSYRVVRGSLYPNRTQPTNLTDFAVVEIDNEADAEQLALLLEGMRFVENWSKDDNKGVRPLRTSLLRY